MRAKLVVLVLVVFAGFGISANGQMKIAYADVDYIFSKLPDAKTIENSLKSHQTQLQSQLQAKYAAYQAKVTELNNLPATTPENEQRLRMNELARLEQDIREFEAFAQESMENKRVELLDPVYAKVGTAINAVAEEKGYDYVLTAGVGGTDIVLFAKDEHDISDLILVNLGISVETEN